MDWAGIVLERLTGQTLGQYMEENIFRPLGLNNISMLPSKEMKAKLAYMHQRTPDGRLTTRDHLLRRALTVTETDENSFFHSGGAGCFSTASDYARMLLPIPLFPVPFFPIRSRLPTYPLCLSPRR